VYKRQLVLGGTVYAYLYAHPTRRPGLVQISLEDGKLGKYWQKLTIGGVHDGRITGMRPPDDAIEAFDGTSWEPVRPLVNGEGFRMIEGTLQTGGAKGRLLAVTVWGPGGDAVFSFEDAEGFGVPLGDERWGFVRRTGSRKHVRCLDSAGREV